MSLLSLIVTKSNHTLTTATMHECIIVVHLEVVCSMSLGEQFYLPPDVKDHCG